MGAVRWGAEAEGAQVRVKLEPWTDADLTSRAVLVVTAALLGLLILRSDYSPKPVRQPRSRGDVAEDLGRSAGRLVGRSMKAYRDRRTGPPD